MASVLRHLSLDKAMSGIVVAGCIAIIADAEQSGRAPLEPSRRARDCCKGDNKTEFSVSSSQWRQLERDGYLVLDNFLSKEEVREACKSIELLDSRGEFVPSANQREYDETINNEEALVRTDRVYMCRDQDTTGGLYKIRQQLASFARTTADSDFVGFGSGEQYYDSNNLQVPQQMQVSIYSNCTAHGTVGDYYTSHLDGSEDSFLELGLLGWLKARYIRKRYLTCICYLNENWVEGDGGCLRLYKNGAAGSFDSHNYIDVSPIGGRLVVFSSLNQWHAVLPTRATRYACSLWLSHNY